jgi:peptide/nickel transport system substrate-binding protein
MTSSRPYVALALLLVLTACAPPPTAPGGSPPTDDRPSPEVSKTLTVAALSSIKALGGWSISQAGGALSYNEIHSNALVTNDLQGNIEPRLVTALPTLENGGIELLPDGRMRTTWHLRPDVRWHDGQPLTAEDLVFSWRVASDPEIPLVKSAALSQMELIEAPDPLTAVITWKTTFYRPHDLGLREFYPYPRHLLSEAFSGDKQAFVNLPYWTTGWVHLGPYQLVDFGLGEQLAFNRFDSYFLGRPKLARIVMQIMGDANTLYANLQAGAIHLATENTLPIDNVIQLREQWARSGGGIVAQRQGNWRFLAVQFNPEFARPRELSRDVRVRRALYQAIDLAALREVQVPGFSGTEADTFMLANDPRARAVGRPFAGYRYDPGRAAQELSEAGWQRGPDGRLLNAAGEAVQIHLRSTPGAAAKDVEIIAPYWRQLGIDVSEETLAGSLVLDKDYTRSFPSVEATAKGTGDEIFRFGFVTRLRPTAQIGYTGGNTGSYSNPELDDLVVRLFATIDQDRQGAALRALGEILATDLPALPLYFDVKLAVALKGVRALTDDYPGAIGPGFMARNAHLWDLE